MWWQFVLVCSCEHSYAMIFIPLLDKVILPWWGRIPIPFLRPTALKRIGVGMFLASLSFLMAAIVEQVRTLLLLLLLQPFVSVDSSPSCMKSEPLWRVN
jgi:hypothetical protein